MSELTAESFTCPKCGHQALPDHGIQIKREIVQCTECMTRIAFGVAVPRVAIAPDPDRRFLVLEIGDQKVRLDRAFAHAIGVNLVSVSGP